MAADVDSKKSSSQSKVLPAQILTFHRIHNQALGIDRSTHFTVGLEAYARRRFFERELSRVAQAAFLNGLIQRCQEEIKPLITQADTPEKRLEILPVAQKLQEQAEQAERKLAELNNG